MNKKIIESLYGIGGSTSYDDQGNLQPNAQANSQINITRDTVDQGAIRSDARGYELAKSRDFNDNYVNNKLFNEQDPPLNKRQEDILKNFNERKDGFVSYPPSAGKTFPIEAGLSKLFYDRIINNNALTPHILFVVPRKQLAAQVCDDFRSKVFFKQLKKVYKNEQERLGRRINNDKEIPIHILNRLSEQAYMCVAEQTGGQKDKITISFYDGYVPMVVATYDNAKALISDSNFAKRLTHIIVDEVQELVPHPGEGINSELIDKRYSSLVSILSNAPPMGRSCILLMTGSINQTSIKYLANYFNNTYNRKFEVIPTFNPDITPLPYGSPKTVADNHEGQLLNRSNISLQPLKSLTGYPNTAVPARLNLIKNIVVNKQYESVMIIFSKQRTGQGIFRMLEDLIKILPPYPPGYFFEEDNEHVKQVIRNNGQGMRLHDNINIEYLKYFDLNSVLVNNSQEANTGTVKDENNILYQSVIRGVAPLIGPMNQLHKKIVQTYFSENSYDKFMDYSRRDFIPPKNGKRIHMILGTDALG